MISRQDFFLNSLTINIEAQIDVISIFFLQILLSTNPHIHLEYYKATTKPCQGEELKKKLDTED